MILKGIIDEDTVNYKKICMTVEFPYCSFKCDKECGQPVCQNGMLAITPNINIPIESIVTRYLCNPISEAIVFQGLEPFDSWADLLNLVIMFRQYTNDDVVIFTGYKKDEIENYISALQNVKNLIIKFGRYIPGQEPHYDEVLGIKLASDNQYAERIN